jgi:DNA-binding LytR/AlgR family response regulator
VLLSDIIYFESYKRKIYIITPKNKFVFYEKMNNIVKDELLKEQMLRLHVSYFVNKMHIIEFRSNSVIMSNNFEITVSRNYRENFDNYMLLRL